MQCRVPSSIKKHSTELWSPEKREAEGPGRVKIIFPMGLQDVHMNLTERKAKGRPGRRAACAERR